MADKDQISTARLAYNRFKGHTWALPTAGLIVSRFDLK